MGLDVIATETELMRLCLSGPSCSTGLKAET